MVTEYVINTPPRDYWADQTYFGPPSAEVDQAWKDLLRKLSTTLCIGVYSFASAWNLQVLPEEAEQFDDLDTVKMKNGNHLVIMAVHHNLHCLVIFTQHSIPCHTWLNVICSEDSTESFKPDYYYPNQTDEWREIDLKHARKYGCAWHSWLLTVSSTLP